jgi:PKD repeat protein
VIHKKLAKLGRWALPILLVSSLLAIFIGPGVAVAQPTVTRVLPAVVEPGDVFNVTITWTAPADDFNSIGLHDETPTAPSDWTTSVDATSCDPDADSSNAVGNVAEYIWFGPYSSGTAFTAVYQVQVPVATAPGIYTFPDGTLEYFEGESGPTVVDITGDDQVEVAIAPTADFSGTPVIGRAPLDVTFTDLSTGTINSWSWDFGDGGNSAVQNPVHQYTTPGTYTVSLTATGPAGSDTETKTDYITVYPACASLSEIEQAICEGMEWLASVQNPDGSWGTSYEVGRTGMTLVKFVDHAVITEDISPFDPSYLYHEQVGDGFDYLFSRAFTQAIGVQTHGDPDGDSDGIGVIFYDGGTGHSMYETGIALMAIAASDSPNRVVNVPGSDVDGWTFEEVAQDTLDFLAWGQNDGGWERGGWGYDANDVGWSDNSISGFVALGLGYAEADSPFGFGLTIPQFVLDELDIWIDYIQNDVDGDTNDGGSGYSSPDSWVNIYKTGHLLWEMELVGDDRSTERVQDAVDYIVRHWDDPNTDPGWKGSGGADQALYQAMFTMTKGLVRLGINEIDGIDWYDEFVTVLLDQQNVDGSWDAADWGDATINTAWSLLTLQRTAAAVTCVADFSADPTSGEAPLTVEFTDESDGAVSWLWDFGDGTTSTEQNPTHTYTHAGEYTVSLEITCELGVEDTETKDAYIEVTAEEEEAGPPRFAVTNINVVPNQVLPGQQVDVSVNVSNIGESRGSYNVNLNINGVLEQSKSVTLQPRSSQNLTFQVVKNGAGTYMVSVEGMQGLFYVMAPYVVPAPVYETEGPPSVPYSEPGLDTTAIIAIVVIGIVLLAGIVVLVIYWRRP